MVSLEFQVSGLFASFFISAVLMTFGLGFKWLSGLIGS